MSKRLSKRLAVAVFVMLACVGMVYVGIGESARVPEAAESIASIVNRCVPCLAGLAAAYLWAETAKASAPKTPPDA